jgi:hypothetical protein
LVEQKRKKEFANYTHFMGISQAHRTSRKINYCFQYKYNIYTDTNISDSTASYPSAGIPGYK